MVVLDEKIDLERVEQFASQVEFLPKTLKADIAENFSKDQGPDFYQGLLAAYSNAYVICSGCQKHAPIFGNPR